MMAVHGKLSRWWTLSVGIFYSGSCPKPVLSFRTQPTLRVQCLGRPPAQAAATALCRTKLQGCQQLQPGAGDVYAMLARWPLPWELNLWGGQAEAGVDDTAWSRQRRARGLGAAAQWLPQPSLFLKQSRKSWMPADHTVAACPVGQRGLHRSHCTRILCLKISHNMCCKEA